MDRILVVSDDLTGANELGGIALRFGLKVCICHNLEEKVDAEVIIVNTNNRSKRADEVISNLEVLFEKVNLQNFKFVYLKFDSALRGHINLESDWFLARLKKEKLIFCPINPELNRVIKAGVLWLNGSPIHETSFKDDPEFPILHAQVLANLGGAGWSKANVKELENSAGKVLIEGSERKELNDLARMSSKDMLLAGAAAYFESLLAKDYQIQNTLKERILPDLIICGSTHQESRKWLAEQEEHGKVLWDGAHYEIVYRLLAIKKSGRFPVFAFADGLELKSADLRRKMGHVVSMYFGECQCAELFVEGGATADAIMQALGANVLIPEQEIIPGLVRSRVKGLNLHISMKPGSYSWGDIEMTQLAN